MASTCQNVLTFRKFVLACRKLLLVFHNSVLALQNASEQFGCFQTNVHQLRPCISPFSFCSVFRQRDASDRVVLVQVVVDDYDEVSLTVMWIRVQITRKPTRAIRRRDNLTLVHDTSFSQGKLTTC